ncbi:MAG: hypothetical protein ACKJSG_19245, partial [Lentisphaeria bacterium]
STKSSFLTVASRRWKSSTTTVWAGRKLPILKQRALPAATGRSDGAPDGPYKLRVVYDVQDYIDLRNARAGLRR